jgi:hypothetical protein
MIASCWDWPSLKYVYFIVKNKSLDAGGWGPAKGIEGKSVDGMRSTESIAFDDCLPTLPLESLYVGTGDFCIGEIYEKRDNDPRGNADLAQLKRNNDPQSAKVLDLLNGSSDSVLGSTRDSAIRENPPEGKQSGSRPPAIWNSLIPMLASLSSGYAVYKGLQNLSKGNLDAKHLLFAWGAGLAIGITVGQEAARATYFSKEDGD